VSLLRYIGIKLTNNIIKSNAERRELTVIHLFNMHKLKIALVVLL